MMNNKTGKITAYTSAGLIVLQLAIAVIVTLLRLIRYGKYGVVAFPIYLTLELICMLLFSGIFCIIVSLKKIPPKTLTTLAILFLVLYSVAMGIIGYSSSLEYNIANLLRMDFPTLSYLNNMTNLINTPFYAAANILFMFACGHTAMYGRAAKTDTPAALRNTRSRIAAYLAIGLTVLQFVIFLAISIIHSIRIRSFALPVARSIELILAILITSVFGILISFRSMKGKKEIMITLVFMILYIIFTALTSYYLGSIEHRIGSSARFYGYYVRTLEISRPVYLLLLPFSIARNALFSYSLGNANMHGKIK